MKPKSRGRVDGLILGVGAILLSLGLVYAIQNGSAASYVLIGVGTVVLVIAIARILVFVVPRVRALRDTQRARGSRDRRDRFRQPRV